MPGYTPTLQLNPRKQIRAGKVILDCSGPIHGKWIEKALSVNHAKVLLYRGDFRSEEVVLLPKHESFQMISGDLRSLLTRMKGEISLIVDDLGALHFNGQPLDLLKQYYDALSPDGEAWIRFPNSFWVFLEDQHRVSLQDYLTLKLPLLLKKLLPSELDPILRASISSGEGWMLLKKDRHFPKLFFNLAPRTDGGTSQSENSPHSAYLEFLEKKVA